MKKSLESTITTNQSQSSTNLAVLGTPFCRDYWGPGFKMFQAGRLHPCTSYFDVHQGYQGFDTLPYIGCVLKLGVPPFDDMSIAMRMIHQWIEHDNDPILQTNSYCIRGDHQSDCLLSIGV